MKRKNVFMAVLVIMLVLGFALSGCDSNGDSGGEADTWSFVTSANQSQLNGTWRGTYTETTSLIERLGAEYANQFGNIDGIRAKYDDNITVTINASAGTLEITPRTIVETLSGGRINEVWASLKALITANFEGAPVTLTFNDSNHSYTVSVPPQSMPLEGFVSSNQPEINQNNTRIRMSSYYISPTNNASGYLVMNKQ